MPYEVVKRGNGPRPWKIVRRDTGEVVVSTMSQLEAETVRGALYLGEGRKK